MDNVKRTLCLSVCLTFAFGGIGCSASDANVEKNNIKNVILVIGDGMGENHIQNALTYFELSAPTFMSDKYGKVLTYSNDNGVTDSAAAASAMATGQKVNNSSIAYAPDGTQLTSISELAKQAGKKVGIVTTDSLDGATPAGFSSHAKTRGESETIAKGQAQSGIDLFIGKSTSAYQTTYSQFFMQSGYEMAYSAPNMQTFSNTNKLVTLLNETRSSYNPDIQNEYSLKDMVAFALDFLDNDDGYFLMVEGAYIDKFSHDNQLIPALCEVRSLFDTVDFLYNTVGEDTAILITADHETGLLRKAQKKDELGNFLYGSSGHSFTAVPLFVKNFTMQSETEFIENTEIFEICKNLLKL